MTNTVKKINMIDAVKLYFKNYFNFTGRASRSEYWWAYLAYVIVVVVIMTAEGLAMGIDYAAEGGVASNLFTLATLIGWLSLNARRLQDRGHTGWWQLAYLIPILPLVVFIILFAVTQNESHLFALGLVLLWIGIFITFIVFLCLPPKEDENKWGRNPLLPDTGLNDRMSDQSL